MIFGFCHIVGLVSKVAFECGCCGSQYIQEGQDGFFSSFFLIKSSMEIS